MSVFPLPEPWVPQPEAQKNFEQISIELGRLGQKAPSIGTTFPGAPTLGQEYKYSTGSRLWTFTWDGSDWWFTGGPALFAEVTASETTNSASYTALSTPGPTITVPFDGDYLVSIGARPYSDSANQGGIMSYDIEGTGASGNDSIGFTMGSGVSTGNIMRPREKALLAGDTLVAKYRTTGSGTATFENRWMSVLPIRVEP